MAKPPSTRIVSRRPARERRRIAGLTPRVAEALEKLAQKLRRTQADRDAADDRSVTVRGRGLALTLVTPTTSSGRLDLADEADELAQHTKQNPKRTP